MLSLCLKAPSITYVNSIYIATLPFYNFLAWLLALKMCTCSLLHRPGVCRFRGMYPVHPIGWTEHFREFFHLKWLEIVVWFTTLNCRIWTEKVIEVAKYGTFYGFVQQQKVISTHWTYTVFIGVKMINSNLAIYCYFLN